VFGLTRPTAAAIELELTAAAQLPSVSSRFLSPMDGLKKRQLPFFFAHDTSKSLIGAGEAAFSAARNAFERWEMFNLGWVRVANPTARIVPDQVVAVEAYTLGLWSLNFSRIVEVVDTRNSFGFLYATTEIHVEDGEERFLLEFDADSGRVGYTIEAVSRPRRGFAQLGYPITRAFQHKFARDSHRRVQSLVKPRASTVVRKLIP
jgi:uncharacterized protein (UPF0548 family)